MPVMNEGSAGTDPTSGPAGCIRLAARPVGMPVPADFTYVREPVPMHDEGQLLFRAIYVSVDPAVRWRLSVQGGPAVPIAIGGVVPGRAIGRVEAGSAGEFQPGDLVLAPSCGWRSHGVFTPDQLQKVQPGDLPLTAHMNAMGLPGFAAYVGMKRFGRPGPGQTVVVSAAGGSVGALAGQIAGQMAARVVGIAGSAAKCEFVRTTLGFADCVDYRAPDFAPRLHAACPSGIDVYFENVGGTVFDTVLPLLNVGARIPVCGVISQYNADPSSLTGGPSVAQLMRQVLLKRLQVHGYMTSEHDAHLPEFRREMEQWYRSGRIVSVEHIVDGLENAPQALIGLLNGANTGKTLVRVSPDDI